LQQRLGYKGFGSSKTYLSFAEKKRKESGQPQSQFDPSKKIVQNPKTLFLIPKSN
jgi:hypothetical protein